MIRVTNIPSSRGAAIGTVPVSDGTGLSALLGWRVLGLCVPRGASPLRGGFPPARGLLGVTVGGPAVGSAPACWNWACVRGAEVRRSKNGEICLQQQSLFKRSMKSQSCKFWKCILFCCCHPWVYFLSYYIDVFLDLHGASKSRLSLFWKWKSPKPVMNCCGFLRFKIV